MRGYTELTPVTVVDASDPNAAAPDAGRVFTPPPRLRYTPSPGVAYYVEFAAGVAPTASYTIWLKDANGVWISAGTVAADPGRVHRTLLNVPTTDIFFQVTAIAGAPTNLKHRVASI